MTAERHVQLLDQHMLPSRCGLFKGRPWIFQHNNTKLHSGWIIDAWLHKQRVPVLEWSACGPDLFLIENLWCIMEPNIL